MLGTHIILTQGTLNVVIIIHLLIQVVLLLGEIILWSELVAQRAGSMQL